MSEIRWLPLPEDHDYPAARSYLALLLPPDKIDALVSRLQKAEVSTFKAKDILRASGLIALSEENRHVARDLRKIKNNEPLSPIVLVGGNLATSTPLTIADGYHRLCAAYLHDENIEVPCKIVGLV